MIDENHLISRGFTIDLLSLSDKTAIVSGDHDPTSTFVGDAERLPTSSLYVSTLTSTMYQRYGAGDHDWRALVSSTSTNSYNITTVDSDYLVINTDRIILVRSSDENIDIHLGPASAFARGVGVTIKKIDSSNCSRVCLIADDLESIDSKDKYTITLNNSSYTLISNGTDKWWIV